MRLQLCVEVGMLADAKHLAKALALSSTSMSVSAAAAKASDKDLSLSNVLQGETLIRVPTKQPRKPYQMRSSFAVRQYA